MEIWKWAIGLAAIAIALAAIAKATGKEKSQEKPRAKRLLTEREKAMYERLKECFPEANVLAQVSMSALLTAKTVSSRNTFDRKIVDFVLCGKGFDVIAVIELDDSTHRGKENADAKRDQMLKDAGYRTLRFKNIPNREELITQTRPVLEDRTPRNQKERHNGSYTRQFPKKELDG